MENTNTGAAANENNGLQNNAYDAEDTIGQENNFYVPATQTGGIESDKKLSDRDDDEDETERDQETDEDEPTISDWGDYDPLNNGMPSDTDPAAPGSAV